MIKGKEVNVISRPILYSFRRCPYAMRARLAIQYSQVPVELREVVLRDKPADMLHRSPKGTVPVIITPANQVIDESIDIMLWALKQNDPDGWLRDDAESLIEQNDGEFKAYLDLYKYSDRFPDFPAEHYRSQAEGFLKRLESLLCQSPFLLGESLSMADMAVFPFIRQFAHVDKAWFDAANYPKLQFWLQQRLNSIMFAQIMEKYPKWQPDTPGVMFGGG
ncbi:glutathione S-transferase [Gammaproteobacteria bacterium 45_16_T64]|nr:glutathione S-transferase [Gammaproteobacteria bacterium 45_16_T64]